MSFDVTVVEKVSASAVCEHGVLPAEEPAIIERVAVSRDFDCQRLPVGAEGVLKRDVLRREIIGEDADAGGGESSHGLAIGAGHGGAEVEGENGCGSVVAAKMNV